MDSLRECGFQHIVFLTSAKYYYWENIISTQTHALCTPALYDNSDISSTNVVNLAALVPVS